MAKHFSPFENPGLFKLSRISIVFWILHIGWNQKRANPETFFDSTRRSEIRETLKKDKTSHKLCSTRGRLITKWWVKMECFCMSRVHLSRKYVNYWNTINIDRSWSINKARQMLETLQVLDSIKFFNPDPPVSLVSFIGHCRLYPSFSFSVYTQCTTLLLQIQLHLPLNSLRFYEPSGLFSCIYS